MKIKKIVLTAILSSLSIILYEVADIPIPPTLTPIFKISLGIIPIFFIAYYCGTFYAAVSSVIVDVIGLIAFTGIQYFNIGFTISALIGGVIIGLILHNKERLNGKKGLIIVSIALIFFTITSIPFFLYSYYKYGIGATLKGTDVSGNIVAYIAIALNIIALLYCFISYKNKNTNAINLSYIIYQYTISLFLIPISQSIVEEINMVNYMINKLVAVPIMFIVYSLITRLLLKVLSKKYKNI